MHLPKFAAVSLVFTVSLLSSAFGREGLGSSADSLRLSLKNLKTSLEERGFVFKMSSSSGFALIDRTAEAAGAVGQKAGNGESRAVVAESMTDLREHLEKMRFVLSRMTLAQQERAALRKVDIRYGDVVRYWQAYGGSGGLEPEIRRDRVIEDEGDSRPPARSRVAEAPAIRSTTRTNTVSRTKAAPPSHVSGADAKARVAAIRYLSRTYGISPREIQVHAVINLGNKYRVTAFVNRHFRAIDLDPASGSVYLDVLVN